MSNQLKRVRVRWNNVFKLLAFVGLIIVLFASISYSKSYDIEYQEYQVNYEDTLFDIVQNANSYSPIGWNTHDFVELTLSKNNLVKPTDLKAGEVIYVPVAYKKE